MKIEKDTLIVSMLSAFVRHMHTDVRVEDISYVPLLGGKSQAKLYCFELNHKKYVLRLMPTNADDATRAHQALLHRQANALQVCPTIHYTDPDHRGLIMDFILGTTVLAAAFLLWQPSTITQAALDAELENALPFQAWLHQQDVLNLEHYQIGLIALKKGLQLIDQQSMVK